MIRPVDFENVWFSHLEKNQVENIQVRGQQPANLGSEAIQARG